MATALAGALATLHEAGYLHGDVKPSNVGLTSNGSPKLLDFGLARAANDADSRGGTLRYLSPEVLSERPADEADDVGSLCVLLHEMVAGEHPFAGGGIATGADNSVATQRFRVTVLAVTATTTFSKRLVPGIMPLRAIHFLELRTGIAALRTREGLPAVRWTDPILTVGVTPVKRVHLTELRDALGETYDAAGRPRPTYTDPIVTVGMTAIKAVHVVELRNAIGALE